MWWWVSWQGWKLDLRKYFHPSFLILLTFICNVFQLYVSICVFLNTVAILRQVLVKNNIARPQVYLSSMPFGVELLKIRDIFTPHLHLTRSCTPDPAAQPEQDFLGSLGHYSRAMPGGFFPGYCEYLDHVCKKKIHFSSCCSFLHVGFCSREDWSSFTALLKELKTPAESARLLRSWLSFCLSIILYCKSCSG